MARRMYDLTLTKRLREAACAYCHECDSPIGGHWYWPLAKSVWMHERGTGHEVKLYKLALPEER